MLSSQYAISVDNLIHCDNISFQEFQRSCVATSLIERSIEFLDFFHDLNIVHLQAYQVSELATDYNRLHAEKYFALSFCSRTCLCAWIWNSGGFDNLLRVIDR